MNGKQWLGITTLILLVLGTAACTGGNEAEESPILEGPALVMFYTDN